MDPFDLLYFYSFPAQFTEQQKQMMFTNWMRQHQRSYSYSDFQTRYSIWKSNLDFVTKHNSEEHSYTVGMNQFADLTNEEFASTYFGFRMPAGAQVEPVYEPTVPGALPTSFDWRTKGAVTPIKNQGQCGSCWAFSTTGSTEGCHFLKSNKLVSLSEQNLMDCSTAEGNQGCEGGLMTQAMDYIIQNGGVDTESSYPYKAIDENCHFKTADVGATLAKYTNVQSGSEAKLQDTVSLGPVSAAMDASQTSFQLYTSGIYKDPACSSQSLDHGVLVIGWGVDAAGKDYWLMKNSWGTSWGIQGYFWLARNDHNMCGVATMATLPSC